MCETAFRLYASRDRSKTCPFLYINGGRNPQVSPSKNGLGRLLLDRPRKQQKETAGNPWRARLPGGRPGRHLVDSMDLFLLKAISHAAQGYDAVAIWSDCMADLLDMGVEGARIFWKLASPNNI